MMDLSAINNSLFADPSGLSGVGGNAQLPSMAETLTQDKTPSSFEALLRTQGSGTSGAGGASGGDTPRLAISGGATSKVKDAANQLVATAFLQPLLAQLRQDPFKTPLFHGGQGEDAFGAQLDTRVADALAKRLNLPLADKIVQQIVRHQQAGTKGAAATGHKVNLHG